MIKQLMRIAACIVLAAAVHADDFQYTLPPGWVDLTNPTVDTSAFPSNPVNEARTGKYKVYAIDPNNLSDRGANAVLNVIEMPQTGIVNKQVLDSSMNEAEALARARGLTMNIIDKQVAKLGDVDIGVVNSTLGNQNGSLRLVQYFIPGKNRAAVITYGSMPDQFEHYRPLFETSAMATKGAYSHGFKWRPVVLAAVIGGSISLIVAIVIVATSRGSNPAPVMPAPPMAAAMWECPTCKRRVPGRIDVCRCGAARPA